MTTAAIIVAAGRGLRAGGGVPKQWRSLGGRLVVEHALARFAAHPATDRTLLVVSPQDMSKYPLPDLSKFDLVAGGA